ncbi:MAG: pseudouridine synthase [Desulfotomaculaceae bacterium]|nr:pseudouridine synthase [Desulfotomaculaceae bacterium]
MERLQKVMARAGVASRRHCETMIAAGMVKVNGRVVTEPGTKVDPDKDKIQVGGEGLHLSSQKYYLMMYKPRGYITTMSDEKGRKQVTDLLKGINARVYPVGRLDYDSEGLLLLTNDGELTFALTHPSHLVPKTYLVRVAGIPTKEQLEQMAGGLQLEDGLTAPAKVRLAGQHDGNALVEVTIREGRNRQIRRMFEHINFQVLRLRRSKIGNLNLDIMRPGEYRHLSELELRQLKELAGLKPGSGK